MNQDIVMNDAPNSQRGERVGQSVSIGGVAYNIGLSPRMQAEPLMENDLQNNTHNRKNQQRNGHNDKNMADMVQLSTSVHTENKMSSKR